MDLERKIAVGKRETVAERLERHPALKARVTTQQDPGGVESRCGAVALGLAYPFRPFRLTVPK